MSDPCLCSRCDLRRFTDWLDRVRQLPIHSEDFVTELEESGERMKLIFELHASVCIRYPTGIAEVLYGVISSLHIGHDLDAITDLKDLIEMEQEARAVNEDGPCGNGNEEGQHADPS